MNAAIRGISMHAVVETIERTAIVLDAMGLSRLDRDRVSVVVAMMMAKPECTAK